MEFQFLTHGHLNGFLARVGHLNHVGYRLTGLARNVLANILRIGIALVALFCATDLLHLGVALMGGLTNVPWYSRAPTTIANRVSHGVANLSWLTNVLREALTNGKILITALLAIFGMAQAIVFGVTFGAAALSLTSIAGATHIISSINCLEGFGFERERLNLLIERKVLGG
jgi:hypothetical protein